MAWTQLKNAINNAIKANNNQEITGPVLNSVLNSIVNSMGKYATFAGIATPSTNPGVFEGPVIYFANTPGTYPNFDNITVGANKIVALYNINGTWDNYEIGDNNITTSRIADKAVTTEKLADRAVETAKLAPDAVTTAKIANGAVTGDKIAAGTITEDNIQDKSLSQNALADNAVNTAIIQNGAVTTEKLAGSAMSRAMTDAINAEAEARDIAINNEAQIRAKNDENLNRAIVEETIRAMAVEEANAQAIAKRGIYDVSAYNDGAVFESLSALLNHADLSTLIPTSVRCGGMSIRFIQGSESNSDNKYVQYRLMADEFTTDTTQWAIAEESVYVENPEFIRVVLDNEDKILEAIRVNGTKLLPSGVEVNGKIYFEGNETTIIENPEFIEVKLDGVGHILWAIKADGDIYYGAGVPQQVIDYIEGKIAELSLDEYEDIVAFLNGLEEGDKTLQVLLNEKVDKVKGKSLIDSEYASAKSTIDSPEFLDITLDTEGKILEGIKVDGTKVIGGDLNVGGSASINGDTKILGNMEVSGVSYKVIESQEYLAAWVDADNKVIFGLKADGKTYVGDADFLNDIKDIKAFLANITDKNIDWDALSTITTVENPEFIEAKTDSEGKLLAGRTPDGTAFENVGFSTHKVSIDGHIVENIEDPEGRTEIKTDSEGKILSYRDSQGVVHEKAGIESAMVSTNRLNLTVKGMTEFQQALKDAGFQLGGHGDWSDAKELHIAEPYCAKVNFSGINDIPQQKYSDNNRPQCYMEFWDIKGNYFKKEVLINAQGRSTMAHPKKNIAIDICNNNGWDDSDTFSLQIGDWVPQDSFHLKAFYNDPFRCLSPVAYKLWDEICKSKGEWMDYVWKRALIDFNSITPTSTGCADAEEATDEWNTNARCFPMGFPCIVYLNGEFYGIYSWQLKKHRDNYMMSKGKINHIHLDGIISMDTILNANGNTTKIRWTTASPEGFEIRNPKPKKKKDGWDLLIMDGSKYDADANGGELIDETSSAWDANDQSCIKTKQVKDYILNMSKIYPSLKDAYAVYEASSKSPEDKATFKTVYETYFDIDNLVDYLIFSDVLNNYDGFSQNVQWVTYNGVKWYLCAYDLDGVMGNWWQLDNTIVAPNTTHYTYAHFKYLPIFYQSDLEARYKELRDKGILNIEHIYGLVEDWLKRFGAKETFNKEWEKWPSFIKNDNIHRLYKWLEASFANMDSLYNYNQN